jgi:hypothetical protein
LDVTASELKRRLEAQRLQNRRDTKHWIVDHRGSRTILKQLGIERK